MVSAFRAMPSLVSIKRGPGLVLDWSQAAGAFAIGGDSRDIVIWDASSETKVDVRGSLVLSVYFGKIWAYRPYQLKRIVR
jgi:hypothetical protein